MRHELMRHSAAGPLRDRGLRLLSYLQQIHEIQESPAASRAREITELSLADLICRSNELLDALVTQIALCESTARQTAIVADWGRRLLAQERFHYREILPLFSRVFAEAQAVAQLSRLMPIAGLPLATLIASLSRDTGPANFVEGLAAARVLVWALRDDPRQSKRLPNLVLAALFQDVGLLHAGANIAIGKQRRARRSEWLDKHHPSIGAAVLGAIRGAPVELPLMAGEHHERLDGGGFPRALLARDIFPGSAILAATGRFVQLCFKEPDDESSSTTGGGNRLNRVALTLLSEAEWGRWPLDFVTQLSQRIAMTEAGAETDTPMAEAVLSAPAPPAAPLTEHATNRSLTAERGLRLDGEERGLAGMHADPEGRFTAATLDEIKRLSRHRAGAPCTTHSLI